MSYDDDKLKPWQAVVGGLVVVIAGALALMIFFGLIIGVIWGFKSFGRTQARAEAHNQATVARIRADNEQYVNGLKERGTAVKVRVAQQEARIELEKARGVRAAQDEIARTLTPLYVQHQALEALKEVSRNGGVQTIYIPAGENGVPIVSTVPPDQAKKSE